MRFGGSGRGWPARMPPVYAGYPARWGPRYPERQLSIFLVIKAILFLLNRVVDNIEHPGRLTLKSRNTHERNHTLEKVHIFIAIFKWYPFHDVFYSFHDSSTVSRTFLIYSFLFSVNNRAASALAGELGLGSCSSDWIEVRMAATSYVGLLSNGLDVSINK